MAESSNTQDCEPKLVEFSTKLLSILVCPVTGDGLMYDAQNQELVSHAAKLAYPIREGIPVMLESEARCID